VLAVKVTLPFQLSTIWLGGEVAPPGLNWGFAAKQATPTCHVTVVVVLASPRSLAWLDGKNWSNGLPFSTPPDPGFSGP
jgi:hypothetical protein